MFKHCGIAIFTLISLLSGAQPELPTNFIDELLPARFTKPVGIVFDQMGQGYVWEKDGLVWKVTEDGQKSAEPLIDISEEVTSWGDHGLIGFALDPAFSANGWFYLYYSLDRHHLFHFGTSEYDAKKTIASQATIARITRYTADAAKEFRQIVPDSRKIIVGTGPGDGMPILMGSHATGSLVFGEDGSLMFSFGDGASWNEVDTGNAQNTYHIQAIEDGIIGQEDNVGAFKAMQIRNPNGKLLRVDPATGDGLPSNPFYDASDPRAHQSRIWVLGLRNPYKFIKVQNTGSHIMSEGIPGVFLVGDVGSAQWEEVNVVDQPGLWYGWPVFEGHDYKWGRLFKSPTPNPEALNPGSCQKFFAFKDLWKNESPDEKYEFMNPCDQTPIPSDIRTFVHKRPTLCYNADKWNPPSRTFVPGFNDRGRAIGVSIGVDSTESQVIEGGSSIPAAINNYDGFPDKYKDKLFLGDIRGFMSMVTLDESYNAIKVEPFHRNAEGLTDFTFHPKTGALFYVNNMEGQLRKISYGGVLPPIIETHIDKTHGPSPFEVTFNSTNSRSYNGSELQYEWDFGNGSEDTGSIVIHRFESNEIQAFDVALVVTDVDGRETREDYIISINNTPPNVEITSIKNGSTYSVKAFSSVLLEAEVNDSEHEDDQLQYAWRIDLYHDQHFHPGSNNVQKKSFAQIDPVGCELEEYWYRINLTVTDAGGLSSTDYVEIFPYCGPPIGSFIVLKADIVSNGVQLDWTLDASHSIVRFEIEKLEEGIFLPMGESSASKSLQYDFLDERPFLGENTYRIKAFDLADNFVYSDPITITNYGGNGFQIYPNPASSMLSLFTENSALQPIRIKVLDVMGKVLIERSIEPSVLIEESIDIQKLNPGVYFFSLMKDKQEKWQKFLIRR